MSEPYISFVMGIGGNLGADLILRLRESVARIAELATATDLPIEIVIVEWAMPEHSRGIVPELPAELIPIRVIHTGRLHDRVSNPHGFRYFEWYPKNIGIRRANGQFVLSTNPDILHTKEMFQYLATRPLKQGYFYRAIRHDTLDGKVFCVNWPTGPKRPDATPDEIRQNLPRACKWHPNMIAYNASGDFTMMSKTDWFCIRGNPEREYNDSVDGQTLWLAHTMGLEQIVIPYPIYHPDHSRTLNHAFVPEWNDNTPHATMNEKNWGFAESEFAETVIE